MEVPSKGFRVRERPQRKGVGRFHLHARIASAPSDWRPFGVAESSRSGAELTSAKNHQFWTEHALHPCRSQTAWTWAGSRL